MKTESSMKIKLCELRFSKSKADSDPTIAIFDLSKRQSRLKLNKFSTTKTIEIKLHLLSIPVTKS